MNFRSTLGPLVFRKSVVVRLFARLLQQQSAGDFQNKKKGLFELLGCCGAHRAPQS